MPVLKEFHPSDEGILKGKIFCAMFESPKTWALTPEMSITVFLPVPFVLLSNQLL